MKLSHLFTSAILLIALFAGCLKGNSADVPAGFAVIREHVVSAPRNDPPVTSLLDYTLTGIDGKPVTRETLPPLVDMQPGALVAVGSHEFKALVSPHLRPSNHHQIEVVFKADVRNGKIYYLADKDGAPVLLEMKARKN